MRTTRLIPILALALAIVGLLIIWQAGQVSAQGQNLLTNPSFEGGYTSYAPETPQEVADCPRGVCTTAQMPAGWKPWWVKERPTDVNPEYKPAEAGAAGNRVRSGSRAAQYFSFWSTHKAGLRQTVNVPANSLVQFTVWGFAWMTESDDSLVSDYSGTPNMRIGIDPTGGTNPYGPSVVWSGFQQPFDTYTLFSVQAQAQGDRVTVFTYSAPSVNPNSPDYGFKHTDVYWDDASLVVVGGGNPAPPPPTATSASSGQPSGTGGPATATAPAQVAAAPFVPGPTSTPDSEGVIYAVVQPGDSLWAIAARAGLTLDEILELNEMARDDFVRAGEKLIVGYGEQTAAASEEEVSAETEEQSPTEEAAAAAKSEEPTAEPTETLAPTSTAQPEGIALVVEDVTGATVCLKAYEDANQNAVHDAGEELRSGVAFSISDGQSVVSNYVTDGASEPFCIKGLPAGDYRVTRSSHSNETMTTPGDRSISLAEGSTLNLEFGSYVDEQALAAAESASSESVPTLAADASATTSQGSSDGVSGLVIGAVVIAVLLLVAVVVVILSGRRSAA